MERDEGRDEGGAPLACFRISTDILAIAKVAGNPMLKMCTDYNVQMRPQAALGQDGQLSRNESRMSESRNSASTDDDAFSNHSSSTRNTMRSSNRASGIKARAARITNPAIKESGECQLKVTSKGHLRTQRPQAHQRLGTLLIRYLTHLL